MQLPKLIAHRGASALAPENTQLAFDLAFQKGLTWIETDAMLTQDNVVILHHDDLLTRTTGYPHLVSETAYAKIQTLNACFNFKHPVEAQSVPRLDDTLKFLTSHHMGINIEIKPTPGRDKETAKAVMACLQDSGFMSSQVLISSFSLVALEQAYAIAPQYAYGWLVDTLPNLDIGLHSHIPFTSLNLSDSIVSQSLVQSLKQRGFLVAIYTVNDPERAKTLFKMGVNSLFTDCPEGMQFAFA